MLLDHRHAQKARNTRCCRHPCDDVTMILLLRRMKRTGYLPTCIWKSKELKSSSHRHIITRPACCPARALLPRAASSVAPRRRYP